MNIEIIQKISILLRNSRGDNLERAQARFRNLTPKQLSQPYGESGLSCAEILKEYQDERQKFHMMKSFIEERIPELKEKP